MRGEPPEGIFVKVSTRIIAESPMIPDAMIDRIERLFADRGAEEYHGEAVSQLEHALQAAAAGEREGAAPELIVAALLHDIGHLIHSHGEDAAERGIDDRHEELGQRFLQQHFGPAVTEPVRLHVAAKRYLCAVEPGYLKLALSRFAAEPGIAGRADECR